MLNRMLLHIEFEKLNFSFSIVFMTDAELIMYYGGPARLAAKLNWTERHAVQRVSNWRRRGIPAAIKLKYPELFLSDLWHGALPLPAIEKRATGGAVTRRDLRPHDCEQIWPDLSTTQPQKESV